MPGHDIIVEGAHGVLRQEINCVEGAQGLSLTGLAYTLLQSLLISDPTPNWRIHSRMLITTWKGLYEQEGER